MGCAVFRAATEAGRTRERRLAVIDSVSPYYCGEMAEWLKAHAWKACIPQGIQGSNPCLSAIIFPIQN